MMLITIITTVLLASGTTNDCWEIAELGHDLPQRPVILIVGSPGVNVSAYFPWAEALEHRGYNAIFAKPSPTISSVLQAKEGLRSLGDALSLEVGEYIAVSHGYGGTLSLIAGIPATEFGLIGAPLGPHLVATTPGPAPVNQGLPFPTEQTGLVPTAPITTSLSQELAGWAQNTPVIPDPSAPVVTLASDADVIAPPESVRLPTSGWSDRVWLREGFLSNTRSNHADLLLDTRSAIAVIRAIEAL
jgi:hypothetical protein